MAEPGIKLRIEQPDLSPTSTRVWLNDQDISSGCRSVSLEWGADVVTEATITFSVRELEVDVRAIVGLIARAKDPAVFEDAIRILKRAKAELPDGLSE
jgi:hypothetical protein